MSNEDKEFELIQNDELVASASGFGAWNEIMSYAAQYGQDGPLELYEVTRKLVDMRSLAAPAVANAAPKLPPVPVNGYGCRSMDEIFHMGARAAIAAQAPKAALTDDQIRDIWHQPGPALSFANIHLNFARAIESAAAPNAALVEALQTIAAQSSGIPGSTARADCMAAIARAAIAAVGVNP